MKRVERWERLIKKKRLANGKPTALGASEATQPEPEDSDNPPPEFPAGYDPQDYDTRVE